MRLFLFLFIGERYNICKSWKSGRGLAMSFNQLKVEDIEKAFTKIYENACELIEDAELLYNNGRYARSYLCSHIAFEEFGKLPMLNSIALDIYFGKSIEWKNLDRRIRNHKSKLTQGYTVILYIIKYFIKEKGLKDFETSVIVLYQDEIIKFIKEGFILDIDSIEETLKGKDFPTKMGEPLQFIEILNGKKNDSLYSDFAKKNFLKPSESIDKNQCELGMALAKIQKKFIELPEYHTKGFRLNELDEDEFSKLVIENIDLITERIELERRLEQIKEKERAL